MTIHGESDIYFEWAEGTTYVPASTFKCFDVITSIDFDQPYENSQSRGSNQLEPSASRQGPRMNIIRLGVEFHSMDFPRLAMFKGEATTKRVAGESVTTIQGEFKKGGQYFDFTSGVVTNVTMDLSMTGPVTGTVEIHALTAPNAAATGMSGGSHAAAITTAPYAFGSIVYLEKNSVEKSMRSANFSLTNQASESHAFNSTGATDPTGIAIGGFEHTLSVVLENDGIVDFDLAEAATADTLILHLDDVDTLTFSDCVFTNSVLGSDNGIDIITLSCLNSGVAIAAAGYDT